MMQATLHLTSQCNMRCAYCYVNHAKTPFMSPEVIRKALSLIGRLASSHEASITFFGGEPLLCKELIYEAVAYSRSESKSGGTRFHFRVVTNGLLLDDDFLNYADQNAILIALSLDGISNAHDVYRLDANSQGTHSRVSMIAKKLLSHQICSPVMMVVNPGTVQFFSEGIDYLYQLGFRYIICSINYSAQWDAPALNELKRQYDLLAKWYYMHTIAEDKFYLSPFEVKIESHIKGENWCLDRCELGRHHLSFAMDGTIYPCVQFVGNEHFAIGHVDTGLDNHKRLSLFETNSQEKEECTSCCIRSRCLHTCGCLNHQVTGRIDRVAPSLCAHERILLPIADRLAEKLYKERSAMFIQKQYNGMYPFLSLIEDRKVN